ncbi:MAG: deoxyuridine 5'-triphosphate nucleotidohydrolase [Thermoprotei archaeon]|nr:MAG: deoxyuridine 5'-triphosphate nucleotidohydrolase [Thermoprotei archaeon]RLF22731.1 MAG: deoxyuridine 5'-triphosphate nucleotidohydrolase [Thermoprotei archaeon]
MSVLGDSILLRLISEGLVVKGAVDIRKQLQPAGVELTVAEIMEFEEGGCLDFSNERRRIPRCRRLEFNEEGFIDLKPGAYKIRFNEVVRIPNDCIAIGFPRSSLIRSGATVLCALWDPGYVGRSEALLVVFNPRGIRLYRNARVLQLVFIKAQGVTRPYSGVYQFENVKEV